MAVLCCRGGRHLLELATGVRGVRRVGGKLDGTCDLCGGGNGKAGRDGGPEVGVMV